MSFRHCAIADPDIVSAPQLSQLSVLFGQPGDFGGWDVRADISAAQSAGKRALRTCGGSIRRERMDHSPENLLNTRRRPGRSEHSPCPAWSLPGSAVSGISALLRKAVELIVQEFDDVLHLGWRELCLRHVAAVLQLLL